MNVGDVINICGFDEIVITDGRTVFFKGNPESFPYEEIKNEDGYFIEEEDVYKIRLHEDKQSLEIEVY